MVGYALIAIVVLSLITSIGCQVEQPSTESRLADELKLLNATSASLAKSDEVVPREIALFCSDCHALPNPASFPREVWYEEVEKGFEFYARSGRSDLSPPPLEYVLDYYRERAAEDIVFPPTPAIDLEWLSRFDQISVVSSGEFPLTPAIASLQWVELLPEEKRYLVACDMRDGSVSLINVNKSQANRRLIGRVGNPARAKPCDLNLDGRTDFVVADLGSFNPYDHVFGKVVWLQREADSDGFAATTLAEGLGRVADVAVGDLSGDGVADLLVAEFGHRRTGSIQLFVDDAAEDGSLNYTSRVLDSRPGTIQIPLHDWDRDGQLDFAAVVSQEFECVDLFLNRGTKFDRLPVGARRDLTFGSIGIELADIDSDGDQDILYVNGDTFDNNFANLTHGVQCYENIRELGFRYHRLADLPGAYRVVPTDIDTDGDVDLLAVANLPTEVYPVSLNAQKPASLVLLEQQMPFQFTMHVLQRGDPRYAALEAADFNGDGKVDFAVGAQLFDTDPPDSTAAKLPPVVLWMQK